MPMYEFQGVRPVIDPAAFVHPEAVVIGDVHIGPGCLVAPGASLRGDIGRITMKAGSNVQDNCVVHVFPGRDVTIEEGGHVGHGSILHGCTIRRNALVGMHCVIMDDAEVGEEAFIAAMALVKAAARIPPRTLAAGIPAKVMRELTPDEIAWKTQGTKVYQELSRRYLATLRPCSPLRQAEPDRPALPDFGYRPKHEE